MAQVHDNFKASLTKVAAALKNWVNQGFAAKSHTHSNYSATSHNHNTAYAAKSHTHTIANITDIKVLTLAEYNALTTKENKIYICLE